MPNSQCIHIDEVEVQPVAGPNVKLVAHTGTARLLRSIERATALKVAYDIIRAIGEAEDRESTVVVPILGERPREYAKLG